MEYEKYEKPTRSTPEHLRPDRGESEPCLPENERVALRARAVRAVGGGEKLIDVARRFGVTRQTLHNWVARYRRGGTTALAARRSGRVRRIVLQPSQEEQVAAAIVRLAPTTVHRRYTRWTKRAIADFVEQRFGVLLSPWQVDSHLRRWGFASHKAVRQAFRVNQALAIAPTRHGTAPAAAANRH